MHNTRSFLQETDSVVRLHIMLFYRRQWASAEDVKFVSKHGQADTTFWKNPLKHFSAETLKAHDTLIRSERERTVLRSTRITEPPIPPVHPLNVSPVSC